MKITFSCLPELEPILPKPLRAKRGIPDWLKSMPMTAPAEEFTETVKTVKQCPPFIDAMSSGTLMRLPCDVRYENGAFEWDWRELPAGLPRHTPRTPLSFHLGAQLAETPLFAPDTLSIKFMNHWLIETEPGWSMLFTHPVNRFDLPFRSLTGIVDTDRYGANYVHFPAIWNDPGFAGVLPKGTPVAQCFPLQRETAELAYTTLDAATQSRLLDTQREVVTPEGSYKRRFRVKKA